MDTQQTLVHVQRAIIPVNPAARLIAAFNQITKNPLPNEIAPPGSLAFWCTSRLQGAFGVSSFVEARKIPAFNTLLGFGYLRFSEDKTLAQPSVNLLGPPPAALTNLEPDFFPTLVTELQSEISQSPTFAQKMNSAQQEVSGVIARLPNVPKIADPGQFAAPALSQSQDNNIGVVVAFVLLVFATLTGKTITTGSPGTPVSPP